MSLYLYDKDHAEAFMFDKTRDAFVLAAMPDRFEMLSPCDICGGTKLHSFNCEKLES